MTKAAAPSSSGPLSPRAFSTETVRPRTALAAAGSFFAVLPAGLAIVVLMVMRRSPAKIAEAIAGG